MNASEREMAFKEWMLRHPKRVGGGTYRESSARGYASHLRSWRKRIRAEKMDAVAAFPDNLFEVAEGLEIGRFHSTVRALPGFTEYIEHNHHNLDNALMLYEEFLNCQNER